MEQRLKERLTGAVVLLLLGVIVLPLLLDDTRNTERRIRTTNVPERPAGEFGTRLAPLPGAEDVLSAPDTAGEDTAGPGGWVVQVGSFSKDNADELNNRLRAAGYRSYIVDEPVASEDGSLLYRVRVGPEVLRSAAQKLQAELEQDVGLEGLVLDYP